MRHSPATGPVIDQLRPLDESHTLVARISADEAGLRRALDLTRAFAARAALADQAADRLAIVVEEWIANVVEHGAPAAGSRIGLSLGREDAHIRVSLSDAGLPFDLRDVRFEGPNLERGGGVGLELIRTWCRVAGYGRRGGRNRLELELGLD
ncbi:MAG: ATP-binding protein [Phenylobacterium sp.]|nr:ATP-binding protein [Phenylobacterium sp.]